MKFGFLMDSKEFSCKSFSIKTVANYDQVIKLFYETTNVSQGWIYGPERELQKSIEETKKFKLRGPIVCDDFYRLEPTHEIISDIDDDQYLRFMVLGYGFLQGLYLTPEGYSCIGRVPYERGKLNGLILSGNDYVRGMEKISAFYLSASQRKREQMFASIHWFLAGQSYSLEWDIFDAQYKVLDGVFNMLEISADSHAARPLVMARKFGIKEPEWMKLTSKKESKLSKERNTLSHQGQFGGSPIGYQYPEENYRLELVSFNTKLIAAAIGIDAPYISAEPDNRCYWGWDIRP